jgi:hypothetical protein
MSAHSLWASKSTVINMARTAPERSNFFVRSNYAVDREPKRKQPAVEKHTFLAATYASLDHAEQALRGIEQGTQAEAALRELSASLNELRQLRASDPGLRMAAQDLFDAAEAITVHRRAGAGAVDIRLWRLLKQAEGRLRARLA